MASIEVGSGEGPRPRDGEGAVARALRSAAAHARVVLAEVLAVVRVLLAEGWRRLRASSPAWFAYLFAGWLVLAATIAVAGLLLFVVLMVF